MAAETYIKQYAIDRTAAALASRQKGFIDPSLAGLVAMACVCVVMLAGVL